MSRLCWCWEQLRDGVDIAQLLIGTSSERRMEVPLVVSGDIGATLDVLRFLDCLKPTLHYATGVKAWVVEGRVKPRPITLSLEILEQEGVPSAAHQATENSLEYPCKADFAESIQRAWAAAVAHSEGSVASGLYGRWRVQVDRGPNEPSTGAPNPPLEGPSASGQAARGWYHALRRGDPDPSVLALCEVLDGGRLGPVGDLAKKVEGIKNETHGKQEDPDLSPRERTWVDTILVVDEVAPEERAHHPPETNAVQAVQALVDSSDTSLVVNVLRKDRAEVVMPEQRERFLKLHARAADHTSR